MRANVFSNFNWIKNLAR